MHIYVNIYVHLDRFFCTILQTQYNFPSMGISMNGRPQNAPQYTMILVGTPTGALSFGRP